MGGNAVANFRAVGCHFGKLMSRDEFVQTGFEAWPRAGVRPPILHPWPMFRPQVEQPEIIEPRGERHQVDVGKRRIGAQDPRSAAGQCLFEQLEGALISGDSMHHERRLYTMLVGRFEAIGPARVADIAKALFANLFRHGLHPFPEHGGKADLGRAIEQALVDHLAPQPHAALQPRIGGDKPRRLRKRLVDIFADQRRLDHRLAVVHQRRHHAFGIELEIVLIVLLGFEQIDPDRLPFQPLRPQRDADLLAAHRVAEIVEDEAHATFLPHSRAEAMSAPWRIALSLSQTTGSMTHSRLVNVPKPQSVEAMTRSRSPMVATASSMRRATTSGCSTKLLVVSTTPGMRIMSFGNGTRLSAAYSWAWRGLENSIDSAPTLAW